MEKFLDIIVSMDSVDGCNFSNRSGDDVSIETIGGIEFLVELSSEGAVGNVYQTLSYSVTNGRACVSLYFTLHSGNPGNYSPPIDEFDMVAESEIFEQIVATFAWLD